MKENYEFDSEKTKEVLENLLGKAKEASKPTQTKGNIEVKVDASTKVFHQICPICTSEFTHMLSDVTFQTDDRVQDMIKSLGLDEETLGENAFLVTTLGILSGGLSKVTKTIQCPVCKNIIEPFTNPYPYASPFDGISTGFGINSSL